jgi:UDP-N-acetylmuramoylalanine--D-glutamate ligase
MSDPIDAPVLVYGLGITNRAAARALRRRGHEVVVADDGSDPAVADAAAAHLGLTCAHPVGGDLDALVAGIGSVLPTPGLSERHPLFDAARRASRPIISELDLAAAWDDRPVVAITGTNGKTTVTTLVRDVLRASGIAATDAGNTEIPLVEAIDDPTIQVFVVEASSFRLGHSRRFAPHVGTWLNFAPDHLDVHMDLDAYERAKASIWQHQQRDDIAVANADDDVVLRHVPEGRGRLVTFGLGAGAAYHQAGDVLRRPDGTTVIEIADLPRSLPHDRANALAAAASADPLGATPDATHEVLMSFSGLRHRVELVGERGGVRWFDDSKATAPHATAAAAAGFDSVVLIAGGRNKGLDLHPLGGIGSVRAVVAIGESADEVVAAFPDRPAEIATSMDAAVDAAARLSRPGDTVLLSPGCASFDWYSGYGQRGDDFVRAVRELVLDTEVLR